MVTFTGDELFIYFISMIRRGGKKEVFEATFAALSFRFRQ